MVWDRAPQLVPTERSARMSADEQPRWECDCGHLNVSTVSHCSKCSVLKREERELRQSARSEQGLGRGGGYFERDTSGRRDMKDLGQAKNGLDIYGRRRTEEKKGKKEEKETKADRQSRGCKA
ncbi:unnamed protein product [Effrenium voratum]|uniref:RanBP2-type domain-containing protein n=1 Tax=Effrenium voratum TaxID=2562239 RepID=A0AA36IR58_9DINO|nr:unnamed protein product [Effrenium voratum]